MKYRTKIYLTLIVSTLISATIGIVITYYVSKNIILKELHASALSIINSSAFIIDSELVKQIKSTHDTHSSAYKDLQLQLKNIRDLNRRIDIFVKDLYIISPASNHKFIYLVDANDHIANQKFSDKVSINANSASLASHLTQIYFPLHRLSSLIDEVLIAYAPIYDKNGQYVASICLEISMSGFSFHLNNLLGIRLFVFLSIIILTTLISAWYLSRSQTISLKKLYDGVNLIKEGDLNYKINIKTYDEFGVLGIAINNMVQGLRERERLLMSFTRYVSKHVMESILKSEESIKLSGENRKVTILFSDIRNFTAFASRYDPEQVVSMLNEYFEVMVEVVFRNHGILDKFIGDGMMIEFGVPLDDSLQELHAVQTALEMRQELSALLTKWKSEGKPIFNFGIGIHTGMAVVGNIGSDKHIEYTAIGDTVNIASRIEQLTKQLQVPILISATTVAAIDKDFRFKSLGPQQIRGHEEEMIVYTIDNIT